MHDPLIKTWSNNCTSEKSDDRRTVNEGIMVQVYEVLPHLSIGCRTAIRKCIVVLSSDAKEVEMEVLKNERGPRTKNLR